MYKALEKIAAETGLTVSNMIREATWEFVKSRIKEGEPPIRRDKDRAKGK